MRKTKKQRYFVETPCYENFTPAKIHKAEIVSRRRHRNNEYSAFSIIIENHTCEQYVPASRVYNSFQAALAAKKEFDLQEIIQCELFIRHLKGAQR